MHQNSNKKLKTLLKISFLFLLLACSSQGVKKVEKIDAEYGVQIDDFAHGLTYFDTHIRENPLNQEELGEIISKLQKIKEDRELVDFRVKLFQAEKLYKSGSRRPFASYDQAIRCSKSEEFLLSLDEVEQAVNLTKDAMETFPEVKEQTGLPRSWPETMEADNKDIMKVVNEKRTIVHDFCKEYLPEQS